MTVLAIDPGYEQSAYVLFDGEQVTVHGLTDNGELRRQMTLGWLPLETVVIEQMESMGMPVGREVFETCVWTGRFMEIVWRRCGTAAHRMPRRAVKLHLCQSARAKDANVRQALLDRFGGEKLARGRKSAPGPLYGLKADEWQALALAVTWLDLRAPKLAEVV